MSSKYILLSLLNEAIVVNHSLKALRDRAGRESCKTYRIKSRPCKVYPLFIM